MLKELGISLALVSSGMGIGKTSEAAFRALVLKNCPKLLAFASEVGIDATMSIVADYAITGQIDLSGEGIAQLQSILVGFLHAKGNFSSYLNTHAGNVTTKPTDVTQKPRIDDLQPGKNVSETGAMHSQEIQNSSEIKDNTKSGNNSVPESQTIQSKPIIETNTKQTTPLNDFDSRLKGISLDNEANQKEVLKVLEDKYPSSKGVPRRINCLKKVQQLINSPGYEKLDGTQRELAKLLVLRQNLGIIEKELLYDAKLPGDLKRRFIDMDNCVKNQNKPELAAALYRNEDFEVLLTVLKTQEVDENIIKQMIAIRDKAMSNGCLLVNNTKIDYDKIEERSVEKNGKEYKLKVLDSGNSEQMARLGLSEDEMRLTVHMADDINTHPAQTVGRMNQSECLNLSASMTNGKNGLYGNQQVGIVLEYDTDAVSYASNYAAGTGFCKKGEDFARVKLSLDKDSAGTFIRTRFIENLKILGEDISIEDYMTFSRKFQNKSMSIADLRALAKNNMIDINGKNIPMDKVESAFCKSTDDLMNTPYEMRGKMVTNGFNELNIYNPKIKAIYARANSPTDTVETILSAELLAYAEKHNIPIVFQRKI